MSPTPSEREILGLHSQPARVAVRSDSRSLCSAKRARRGRRSLHKRTSAFAEGPEGLGRWNGMLFGKGEPVGPGDTALVVGAGGGVASAAIQLARLAGARVLATTSAAKRAHVEALGA